MGPGRSPKVLRADVLVVVGVIGLAALAALPRLSASREAARLARCSENMRQLGLALQSYHESNRTLPYAARWVADGADVANLDTEPYTGRATRENWVQMILPRLGRAALSESFNPAEPVTSNANKAARVEPLAAMTCPADTYNRSKNLYRYEDPRGTRAEFARGNYAINGGSQAVERYPGLPSGPSAEGHRFEFDPGTKAFAYWGNGVAGINKSFNRNEFTNGLATLAAVDEVRAGVAPGDPRGVWAFGQVGGSITFAHGVAGDDPGPNNQGERADDVLGCDRLYETIGGAALADARMPCCSYRGWNAQATARSLHPGGVNTLMMDGAVKFVRDAIDASLWHALHSRDVAPGAVRPEQIDRVPPLPAPAERRADPEPDRAAASAAVRPDRPAPSKVVNSIGMTLALIPSGGFVMGVADVGFEKDVPPECPPHRVRLSSPFYLAAFEVTQGQYREVMGSNPSHHTTSSGLKGVPEQDTSRLPVEQVSWEDAAEFCRRLSARPGERASGLTYRLPTEAEWEFACRGGRSDPYRWGAGVDLRTGENAGNLKRNPLTVGSVGAFPPNNLGLYDMRGNVYEWCADWFARDYYARSPSVDPQGPDAGFLRVVRGGDWLFVGEGCMINRRVAVPSGASAFLGFRVAAGVPPDTSGLHPAPLINGPDAAVVAYSSGRDPSRFELLELGPGGGPARLVSGPGSLSPSFRPDGGAVAVAREKRDLVVSGPGGAGARDLTGGAFRFVKAPSWSPAGSPVVFSGSADGSSWDLYAADPSGSTPPRRLGGGGTDRHFPAWSPDGRRLAFVRGAAGRPGLFELAVSSGDGSGARALRGDVPEVAAPSWSPDGSRLAYTAWGDGPGRLRLVVEGLDGSGRVAVTPGGSPGSVDVFPSWSPDGSRVAYAHYDGKGDARGDLVVYDVASGAREVVSSGTLPSGEEARPAWRLKREVGPYRAEPPDRGRPPLVVYCSERDPSRFELLELGPGGGPARLVSGPGSLSPSFRPDGGAVAVAREKRDLVVSGPGGAGARDLTGGAFRFVKAPSWSPAGSPVVFSGSADGSSWDLYAADPSGSTPPRRLGGGGTDRHFPAWSPDGRRLAFVRGAAGRPGLFELAVSSGDGSGARALRGDVPEVAAPSWSPDGSRLAYTAWGDGPGRLRLVVEGLDGSGRVAVTPGGSPGSVDVFPSWSPDGSRVAYAHYDGKGDARGDLVVYDVASGAREVVSSGTLPSGEEARPAWAVAK